MPVSILIVDDHPVICHGLKRVLEKQDDFIIVGDAGDWKTALSCIEKYRPDIVILDITLQGIDGISLIPRIKKSVVDTRIIMHTMHSSRDYISRSFQAGALGYILKSDKTEQLITAIRSVMQGKVYLSNNVSDYMMSDLLSGRNAADITITSTLTSREYEVASLIAQGQNPDQIAEILFISPKTVRVHRTKIMHKLSCSGVHELLLKLREYFPQ